MHLPPKQLKCSKILIDEDVIDFEFPPKYFKSVTFQTFEELFETLRIIGLKACFDRGRVFKKVGRNKYMYREETYTCEFPGCESQLIYIKFNEEGDVVQNYYFDNLHRHRKVQTNKEHEFQKIQQFILSMPPYQDWENFYKWLNKYKIEKSVARAIVRDIYWFHNTEDELLTRMAYQGNIVRRTCDDYGNTLALFVATPTMKSNFLLYGEAICFSFSNKLLRKHSAFGVSFYNGCFFGYDENLRLVLLGICVLAAEEKPIFKDVFEMFLTSICEERCPQSICTKVSEPISSALHQLRQKHPVYNFIHINDWYSVTSILQQRLKPQPQNSTIFYLFRKLLSETSRQIFAHIKNIIQSTLKDKQILLQFEGYENKCCLCLIPTCFIGFSIHNRLAEAMDKRCRTSAVCDSYTGKFFYHWFQVEKALLKMLKRATIASYDMVKNNPSDEMHQIYEKIEHRVMECLVREYDNSGYVLYQRQSEQKFKCPKSRSIVYFVTSSITAEDIGYEYNRQFRTEYMLEHGHWHCQCRIQYLLGLPCAHIIRMLRVYETNGSLEYYIHEKWLHDKSDLLPQQPRTLITRRRRRC